MRTSVAGASSSVLTFRMSDEFGRSLPSVWAAATAYGCWSSPAIRTSVATAACSSWNAAARAAQ